MNVTCKIGTPEYANKLADTLKGLEQHLGKDASKRFQKMLPQGKSAIGKEVTFFDDMSLRVLWRTNTAEVTIGSMFPKKGDFFKAVDFGDKLNTRANKLGLRRILHDLNTGKYDAYINKTYELEKTPQEMRKIFLG